MNDTASRFRLIANHQEEVSLDDGAWEMSPCWPYGCTLYWDDLPDHRVRIQHGDNGEAVREFVGGPIEGKPDGGWIDTGAIYIWLRSVHVYEALRRL